jgi:hypothetical protein
VQCLEDFLTWTVKLTRMHQSLADQCSMWAMYPSKLALHLEHKAGAVRAFTSSDSTTRLQHPPHCQTCLEELVSVSLYMPKLSMACRKAMLLSRRTASLPRTRRGSRNVRVI